VPFELHACKEQQQPLVMEVASSSNLPVVAPTVLHWYTNLGSKDARFTYDDKETLLCFISFPFFLGSWNVEMFTDESRSTSMMKMSCLTLPLGQTTADFDDRVSNTSFVMSTRAFACKFDFQYKGTVYAWRDTNSFGDDRVLLRYPAKTEVALFDKAGLALDKVGKIHVQPRSELPLHIIAGTLYMTRTIEQEARKSAARRRMHHF
jgi:hypothetical protein